MHLSEELFEQHNTDSQDSLNSVLANQIMDILKDKLNIIEKYNGLKQYITQSDFNTDILSVLDKLEAEENSHVGALQEILTTVSPNAENIEIGKEEAEEELNN